MAYQVSPYLYVNFCRARSRDPEWAQIVGIMPRMSPVLGRGPRKADQGAQCLSVAILLLPPLGYGCPMFGGIRSHLVMTCGNRAGDLEIA